MVKYFDETIPEIFKAAGKWLQSGKRGKDSETTALVRLFFWTTIIRHELKKHFKFFEIL